MPLYPIAGFVLAVFNWISVEKKWPILEYITKPAIMLILLFWIGASTGLGGSMIWFTLGAVFCLLGDVFLMIPRDFFIFGLVAFLIGHLFYIVGFNDQPPYFSWLGAITIVLIAVYITWLYPKLARGLRAKGKKQLLIPVFIYAFVISAMVYSAVITWARPLWPNLAALSVTVGAVLFYASDSILAWDRFVDHIPHGRTANLIAYHTGQFGIIFGAIYHILNQ
jgi:uncharacterized membrane protein YhhN